MAQQPIPPGSQQALIQALDAKLWATAVQTAKDFESFVLTLDNVTALIHEFAHVLGGVTSERWISDAETWVCARCGWLWGEKRTHTEWNDRIEEVLIPK